MKVVKIRGRNRIDVKKRVLDYYFHPTQVTNGRRKGMEARLYPLSSFLAFNPCQASTHPAEILP
jgi:hypothetical protein